MRTENEFRGLEEALVRVGKGLSYPSTPPIASRVREQLDLRKQTPQTRPHMGWLLLATAALALMFAATIPEMPRVVGNLFVPITAQAATLTPRPSMTPTLASLSVPAGSSELEDSSRPEAVPVPISTHAAFESPSAVMTPVYTAQNNIFPSRSN